MLRGLLHSVGLADVANCRPGELPFGLQKRLDLARAMAENRNCWLAEPFGGLDGVERALLARHIRRLHADGTAVVVIDHLLDDLFSVAHRALTSDFGRTIGEGTPDTVPGPRRSALPWESAGVGVPKGSDRVMVSRRPAMKQR
ncbi:hypothetical protein GCM10010304_06350 [Streptomyces roseoviolaceus]